MNLSLELKKIANKQYQLTARERLLVIIAIGVFTIAITLYTTNSEVVVEQTLPKSQIMVKSPSQSNSLPQGQIATTPSGEQNIRDPFAKIPEIQEQKTDFNTTVQFIPNRLPPSLPNSVPPMVPKSSTSPVNLRLTGIAGTSGQELAVIMSGNKSKSYSVNEIISDYKIINISQDSVLLQKGNEKIVLRLEAAGQKGDNNSAK